MQQKPFIGSLKFSGQTLEKIKENQESDRLRKVEKFDYVRNLQTRRKDKEEEDKYNDILANHETHTGSLEFSSTEIQNDKKNDEKRKSEKFDYAHDLQRKRISQLQSLADEQGMHIFGFTSQKKAQDTRTKDSKVEDKWNEILASKAEDIHPTITQDINDLKKNKNSYGEALQENTKIEIDIEKKQQEIRNITEKIPDNKRKIASLEGEFQSQQRTIDTIISQPNHNQIMESRRLSLTDLMTSQDSYLQNLSQEKIVNMAEQFQNASERQIERTGEIRQKVQTIRNQATQAFRESIQASQEEVSELLDMYHLSEKATHDLYLATLRFNMEKKQELGNQINTLKEEITSLENNRRNLSLEIKNLTNHKRSNESTIKSLFTSIHKAEETLNRAFERADKDFIEWFKNEANKLP